MTAQVSVFAENKMGKLADVTRILKDNSINIRAMKISSSEGFGVLKILVDKPKLCYEKLKEAGFSACLRDIIGVIVKDESGGLYEVADMLSKNNFNIDDCYGYVIEDKKKAVLIIETKETEKVKKLLDENNISYCNEDDLYCC